uniref:Uncharacterized protein n=1 Tax=Arundo donax TaxID=35708 RepID=A0A0A8Y3K7_ARUDO
MHVQAYMYLYMSTGYIPLHIYMCTCHYTHIPCTTLCLTKV